MRLMLLPVLFLCFISCGQEVMKIDSNATTATPPASTPISTQNGILTIPAPGMVGGGPTINYQKQDLQMGTLTPGAETALSSIMNGQSSVNPLSSDHFSTKYRVNFVGVVGRGACPFNPTAQCTVVNLQTITPY